MILPAPNIYIYDWYYHIDDDDSDDIEDDDDADGDYYITISGYNDSQILMIIILS